jgi:hypothetical protein
MDDKRSQAQQQCQRIMKMYDALQQEVSEAGRKNDSGISQAVTQDESRCQCWGPIGHRPILGKRHDMEARQLAENHARRACKKKGNKDNWQKSSGRKHTCRGEKHARPTRKNT